MYNIQDIAEYAVMLIEVFAKRFNITLQEAQRYLSRYNALELVQKHYSTMHTQTFEDMAEALAVYCHRKGGRMT